jgi:hypothetical protein
MEAYSSEVAQGPRPQAVAHNVYFLTEQAGELVSVALETLGQE